MGAGKKVLAVDDNPGVRALLGDALRLYGYETWLAASGRAALELVDRSGPPDLLITDMEMPVMDGHELIRLITRLHDIPVIALTADQETSAPQAACVFRKPCDLYTLLKAVDHLLGARPDANGALRTGRERTPRRSPRATRRD